MTGEHEVILYDTVLNVLLTGCCCFSHGCGCVYDSFGWVYLGAGGTLCCSSENTFRSHLRSRWATSVTETRWCYNRVLHQQCLPLMVPEVSRWHVYLRQGTDGHWCSPVCHKTSQDSRLGPVRNHTLVTKTVLSFLFARYKFPRKKELVPKFCQPLKYQLLKVEGIKSQKRNTTSRKEKAVLCSLSLSQACATFAQVRKALVQQ